MWTCTTPSWQGGRQASWVGCKSTFSYFSYFGKGSIYYLSTPCTLQLYPNIAVKEHYPNTPSPKPKDCQGRRCQQRKNFQTWPSPTPHTQGDQGGGSYWHNMFKNVKIPKAPSGLAEWSPTQLPNMSKNVLLGLTPEILPNQS